VPEIKISDSGLEATVTVEPRTTAEDILAALAEAGVTEGRQTSAIVGAVSEASKTGQSVPDVVVAEGTSAHFTVQPQLIHRPRGEDSKLPSLGSFKQLLDAGRPEEVLKAAKGLEVLAVAAGDLLAEKVEGEVEAGKSVRGEAIDSIDQEQASPQFTPGRGVEMGSDGSFTAKSAGYAGVLDGQVAVLPPIWVSPDEMVAAYVNLSRLPGSANYSGDEITSALSAASVKFGLVEERLTALGKGLEDGSVKKVLVPVAAGKFPKKPEDAKAEFTFAYESQSGEVHKDGSIDLKERSGFPSVAEGDLLVTTIPHIPSIPGSTVKGRELDVDDPLHVALSAGENVRLEGEGESQKLFSEINGGVSVQKDEQTSEGATTIQYTVSARDVAQIAGNVDYETGNVSYNGNVEVKGTVVGGFSVKSTGDVVILESVENGVEIEAGGDVTVKQGIVGEKTKVVAKGGVQAKFVQDATIVAGGDVVVDSYIRTANVQTETAVNVTGGGASGGIIGGETWALNSIVSKNVGAEGTAQTLVCVGVLPTLFEEYKKNKEEADKASQTKLALMKSLSIQKLDLELVSKLVEKNPHKKDAILDYLKKATEAEQIETACRDEMAVLARKMEESAKTAHMDVTSTAFHKIRIRIGDSETVLNENLDGHRFRLNRGGDEEGVGWVPLAEADKE
jgi:uncharacterized protein